MGVFCRQTYMIQGQCRAFRQEQDGATAVEFALISPVLLFFVMAIIESSLVMFAQNILENATFMASRLGKTGYADNGATREQSILALLEERAGSVLDISHVSITTKTYARFDNVGDPEPFIDVNNNGIRDTGENYTDVNGNGQYDTDMGSEGVGNAGEIVVYTVSYPWRIFTPAVQEFLGENGVVTLSARAVVQNEPF